MTTSEHVINKAAATAGRESPMVDICKEMKSVLAAIRPCVLVLRDAIYMAASDVRLRVTARCQCWLFFFPYDNVVYGLSM